MAFFNKNKEEQTNIEKNNCNISTHELENNTDTSKHENNKTDTTEANIPYDSKKVRKRIEHLLNCLNEGLYEKEEHIRLALLSAVAGESIFFMGPPGTAKSMISRRIHKAFEKNTKYFEYLMNEFSTPDEIFGTIKLRGLDDGIYEKNTEGYLPQANIAFLDEIWKSGPAILNTLLKIVNEKEFHNGNKIEKVPLQLLLAASNELPREKSNLEALYDRFIIRTIVKPVENDDSFFNLCENSVAEPNTKEFEKDILSINEVKSWQEKISEIALNEKVREVILQIKKEMARINQELEETKINKSENECEKIDKEKCYVSDRRWKKIIHLLKTSAFLCGRNAVDLMDCQLITYCIWNTKKQQILGQKIVKEIVQQHGLEFSTAIDDIEERIENFENYVNETFYQQKRIPILYKMNDGHNAYKLIAPKAIESYNNRTITPIYISLEKVYNQYSDAKGAYYDSNGEQLGDYDFTLAQDSKLNGQNTLIWNDWWRQRNGYSDSEHSFKVETKAEESSWEKNELFKNPNILSPVQKETDEKHYKPIVDAIENELQQIETFKADNDIPFSENLFADMAFKELIFAKIDLEKQKLEDAKVSLDKQRCRYSE